MKPIKPVKSRTMNDAPIRVINWLKSPPMNRPSKIRLVKIAGNIPSNPAIRMIPS